MAARRLLCSFSVILTTLCLNACAGGGGGSATPPITYTIGGMVSGLWGMGLVLQNNGAGNLPINANGAFTFTAAVPVGGAYNVNVLTQPPNQTCAVTNGSGVANAIVATVQIKCSSSVTYTVGGMVAGLSGSGLLLQDNGRDNLSIPGNGSFTFSTAAPSGGSYTVTVYAQPFNQSCTVSSGSGTANTNVTSVQVTCVSSEQVLYSFGQAPDGRYPAASLIFDTAGNLYGTTTQGGAFGSGTVFKLAQDQGQWSETVLYSFCQPGQSCSDGSGPNSSLVIDAAGNLYGTTIAGGAVGAGVVFELSPEAGGTWTETVLHSFANGSDGSSPAAGLVFDKAGNLYGTTLGGGTSVPSVCPDSCGIVFQLSPGAGNQWAEKVIYTFCSHSDCTDGARPASQLIFDSIGNLYGTTQSGGSVAQHTNGTVFELSPTQDGQWSEVVLYAFQGGGDDGENPEGGLAQDANGNLYGATQFGYSAPAGGANNGTVFKLTKGSQGQWTETLIYGFCSQSGCNDGTQPLTGVILDKSGNAYGTTFSGGMFNWGVVFKLTAQNSGLWPESILYAFEGAGDGFNPHAGLTLDSSGNLYGVAFQGGPDGNGVVFKITP